jgi:hypothetical protein
MRDVEYATLEKEGFKRIDAGIYSAGHSAKIYHGVRTREVHFYPHKHDSTKIVRRIVRDEYWPDGIRKTFVAAASRREAELRLAEIARGGGSISQSWRLKLRAAQKSGDRKTADHWADKMTASILQWEPGRQWLLYDKVEGLNAPPAIREVAKQKYEAGYNADVRRLGKRKADEKWKGKKTPQRFKLDTNGDKIAVAMTMEWLAVGQSGFPGLCFMSDELLAQLLGHTLPLPSLLSDRIRGGKFIWAIRKRVGLKQAEILFNGIEKVADRKWSILNLRGEKTHSITLLPVKPLPPKL